GVLPRDGKAADMKWFKIPVCFVFHTLNAYENGDEVVLLACRMKEYPPSVQFDPKKAGKFEDTKALLHRWRMNLKTGGVKEETVDDVSSEFPRVNDHVLGKKSRYGYTARSGGEMLDGLIKYDLEKGKSEVHAHGKGRFGGEGVFVARPDAKAEDDG